MTKKKSAALAVPVRSVKIDRDSLFFKIIDWWEDHGGDYKPNICPAVRAFLFWIPLTAFMEAGFLTKYKFIRPVTIALPLLALYGIRQATPSLPISWVVFIVIYLLAGVLMLMFSVSEDYSFSHTNAIVRFLAYAVLPFLIIPIILAFLLIKWIGENVNFGPLGRLIKFLWSPFAALLKALDRALGSLLYFLGEVLKFELVFGIQVWGALLIAMWVVALVFFPVTVLGWTIGIVIAIISLAIAFAIYSYFHDTLIPNWRSRRAVRNSNVPAKEKGMTTLQVFVSYIKDKHHRTICLPIEKV